MDDIRSDKKIMKEPNLVNMDTRTVLSGLPINKGTQSEKYRNCFSDMALYNSIFNFEKDEIPGIYQFINGFKMVSGYNRNLIPLYDLKEWYYNSESEFVSKTPYSFKIVFCDISIEGREVKQWNQPLFEANGRALFRLFTCVDNEIRKFLVHTKSEIGAFDLMEIGPSVQRETVSNEPYDAVSYLFLDKIKNKERILFDNVLSEEGRRFYHEENDNLIIEIDKTELICLPEGYFWVTYHTLNQLVRFNNTLNIQLRNIISLLDI